MTNKLKWIIVKGSKEEKRREEKRREEKRRNEKKFFVSVGSQQFDHQLSAIINVDEHAFLVNDNRYGTFEHMDACSL